MRDDGGDLAGGDVGIAVWQDHGMRSLLVIASEAKQSSFLRRRKKAGLRRRFAPRNDGVAEFSRPLIAREQALHCARPAFQLALAGGGAHGGLEAVFKTPVVGECFRLGVNTCMKAGEIGGA